jgi:hypothetical protein
MQYEVMIFGGKDNYQFAVACNWESSVFLPFLWYGGTMIPVLGEFAM